MIRSLRPLDAGVDEQVLYLSIGGITNLAIARGATCEFTRVITTGVEHIVAEVAATAGVPLADARRLVADAAEEDDLSTPTAPGVGALQGDITANDAEGDHTRVARVALADGIRRIAAEVRNSLDFHTSSHGEGAVSRAVLTGPALDLRGFDVALGRELGLTLTRGSVDVVDEAAMGHVPMSRLAVAAGLSVQEGVQ
jgi:type IV pilus assembly protein PilM